MAPFVLIGLPAGAIVDRLPRRPVLVWSDIGRAVALSSIPIAYAFDALSYAQLLAVVFVTGTLTVFFDVAYQSILPALVEREQIVEGNAKLEISRSGAQLAGPGLGGTLEQWIGALVFPIGSGGVLVAALTAGRLTKKIRLGRAIWLGMFVSQLGPLVIALAPTQHTLPYFVAAWLGFGFGGTLYNIDQVSLRQAITPHRLQGRMNASMRFMVWGTMPLGSLAGGVLGTTIGLRSTLLVARIGGLLAVLWVSVR